MHQLLPGPSALALDGATWVTLVTADDRAVGYGDRVDNWELETEILSDGSEKSVVGGASAGAAVYSLIRARRHAPAPLSVNRPP